MANLCLAALESLRTFLLASDGINAELAVIGGRDMSYLDPLMDETVLFQNVLDALADSNEPVVYPAVYLYSDRLDNRLIEKFSKFSGLIFVVADVRVTEERIVGLEPQLARYVEALTAVLENHQGQWTDNLAYNGEYRVKFQQIQQGGQNFLQTARVEIEIQAHA